MVEHVPELGRVDIQGSVYEGQPNTLELADGLREHVQIEPTEHGVDILWKTNLGCTDFFVTVFENLSSRPRLRPTMVTREVIDTERGDVLTMLPRPFADLPPLSLESNFGGKIWLKRAWHRHWPTGIIFAWQRSIEDQASVRGSLTLPDGKRLTSVVIRDVLEESLRATGADPIPIHTGKLVVERVLPSAA